MDCADAVTVGGSFAAVTVTLTMVVALPPSPSVAVSSMSSVMVTPGSTSPTCLT